MSLDNSFSIANKDGQYQIAYQTKTQEGQKDTVVATLNNNVGIFLEKGAVSAGILRGLEAPVAAISGGEAKLTDGDLESVSSAIGMVDLLTGGKGLQKCSLGDLMTIVAFLLLSSAQDQREAQGEMRRLNRDMASQAIKTTFALKTEAAKEAKEAAKKQAIGQIVSGAISVAAGIISLVASAKSFGAAKGGTTQTASGSANAATSSTAADTAARTWQSVAQTASTLGQGISQIISGSLNLSASENTFKSEMLKISAEVTQSFLQLVQENASVNQQNIRDTKQYMDNVVSFLQQTLRNTQDTIAQTARNI